LAQEAQKLGDEYLALEKFVNLNYMVSPQPMWDLHSSGSGTNRQQCWLYPTRQAFVTCV